MTPTLVDDILAHAHAEAPREACGVLVWDGKNNAVYHPCRNLGGEDQFEIHPEDWVAAEDAGMVLGVVHSHPSGTTEPSPADVRGCGRSGVPWWIFTLDGAWKRITPAGWSALGRPFAWGVQDCYTMAMDYFPAMPDFVRAPEFWSVADLFGAGLGSASFGKVEDEPQPLDAFLMSIRGQGVPNHCAVYLGAGRIAHHLPGRLSREEDLGPLARAVVATVRRVSPC